VKVATIQFAPSLGDKQNNLRRLAGLVIEAAENDAQLIVLPELAVSGYSFMSAEQAKPHAEILAEFRPGGNRPGSSMDVMFALASKYRVHIAWGLLEEDYGTGKLFNTQVLLTPEGEFEFYRKVNLWGNDFLWASEGRSNPPVHRCTFDGDTKKKVGLLICRDVRDKKDDSWKSFYEKGDADIVAFSANWGDGGFPAVAWMDFAKENRVTLIVSNRYGKEIPNNFGEGGVCIIEPDGKVHCEGLAWDQDCIVYAELV
jgi:predicted amidohydrolase